MHFHGSRKENPKWWECSAVPRELIPDNNWPGCPRKLCSFLPENIANWESFRIGRKVPSRFSRCRTTLGVSTICINDRFRRIQQPFATPWKSAFRRKVRSRAHAVLRSQGYLWVTSRWRTEKRGWSTRNVDTECIIYKKQRRRVFASRVAPSLRLRNPWSTFFDLLLLVFLDVFVPAVGIGIRVERASTPPQSGRNRAPSEQFRPFIICTSDYANDDSRFDWSRERWFPIIMLRYNVCALNARALFK